VHDVDGDCRKDVVVADGGRYSIWVWRNTGGGALVATAEHAYAPDRNGLGLGASLTFADVDADGVDDVVVAWAELTSFGGDPTGDGAVTLLRGTGGGMFATYSTLVGDIGARSIAVADMNGDAIPDLIFADTRNDAIAVSFGTGSAVFQSVRRFTTVNNPTVLRVVDVDRDGTVDVLAVGSSTPGFVASSTTLGMLPGRCL
jgi:hypothetical protein